jgi:nitrous oxide reductase accessory protein NosL
MKGILIAVVFVSAILLGACKKEEPKSDTPPPVVQQEGKSSKVDSSIVRDKNVDVAGLDLNKDGKVYQCVMHAQVISDVAGQCPICKMDLSEVTIAEAKEALK